MLYLRFQGHLGQKQHPSNKHQESPRNNQQLSCQNFSGFCPFFQLPCQIHQEVLWYLLNTQCFSILISLSLVHTTITSHLDYFKIVLKSLLYFIPRNALSSRLPRGYLNVNNIMSFTCLKPCNFFHLLKTMQFFSYVYGIKLGLPAFISIYLHG